MFSIEACSNWFVWAVWEEEVPLWRHRSADVTDLINLPRSPSSAWWGRCCPAEQLSACQRKTWDYTSCPSSSIRCYQRETVKHLTCVPAWVSVFLHHSWTDTCSREKLLKVDLCGDEQTAVRPHWLITAILCLYYHVFLKYITYYTVGVSRAQKFIYIFGIKVVRLTHFLLLHISDFIS